ncbi:hypothetical protein [Nonlabens sp.]|uniref:hypothetical protein n=1 Tax=Nonlabens sp. TaxID=1888209 RepID=UPI003F69F5FE
MRILFYLIFLTTGVLSAQSYETIALDSIISFKLRGNTNDLLEIDTVVNDVPATGYRYSSEAGAVTVIRLFNDDVAKRYKSSYCINNLYQLKSFYSGNFVSFENSLSDSSAITFKEISNRLGVWLADIEYDGALNGVESTGRCRFIFTKDVTYHVIVMNIKDTDYVDPMLSYGIFNLLKIDKSVHGAGQFMNCKNSSDDGSALSSHSDAYNNGYELGQKLAPFICILFIFIVLGVTILIIVRYQKRKRKKEQEEYDKYNE